MPITLFSPYSLSVSRCPFPFGCREPPCSRPRLRAVVGSGPGATALPAGERGNK